jgi:hypothetical protein
VQITGRAHHQRQLQLLTVFLGQGQTYQSAPITRHEVDILRRYQAGRHHQIAFVFPVFIVHDNHHFSLAKIFNNFFYGIQLHQISNL